MSISYVHARHEKLFDLLPLSDDAKKNISEKPFPQVDFLLNASHYMVEALEGKHYEMFDALVGENACQIRAVKIAEVSQTIFPKLSSLKTRIKHAKDLHHNCEIYPLSLLSLYARDDINITLEPDEGFCLRSFLLHKVKEVIPNPKDQPLVTFEKTNLIGLERIHSVSKTFYTSLVRRLRKQLSKDSVDYIKSIAREDSEVHKVCLQEYGGVYALPFFMTNEVVLNRCIDRRISILVHVDFVSRSKSYKSIKKDMLYFKVDKTTSQYQKVIPKKPYKDKACLTLDVALCRDDISLEETPLILQEIQNQKIEDLFLASSASHRQHLDDKDSAYASSPRLLKYQELADTLGCSLKNPSLFFIKHAYVSSIKQAMKLLEIA